MYRYGFIGTGNMGAALARALDKNISVALSNRNVAKAQALADELGFVATSNEDVAQNSEFVILGVKPQMLPELCPTITDALKKNVDTTGKKPIVITMAAGVKMETLCGMLGDTYPVIRIMPNTPVAIGEGVILASKNELVTDEDFDVFIEDFSGAGSVHKLPENLIDAGTVVSGCGPAYIYMYIDALAKAGAALGLDHETAVALAQETAKGAASLSMQSNKSLEELRIAVCSPGGSTIEGVKSFVDSDLDGVVKKALDCAYKRNKELAGE